jgi:membrane-bound lytic murein transglycosylase B
MKSLGKTIMDWTRRKALATCMILPLLFNGVSVNAQIADPQAEFNQTAKSIRNEAAQKGVSQEILNRVFTNLSPVPGLAELERKQPEQKPGTKKTPATPAQLKASYDSYMNIHVTNEGIQSGRALMAAHAEFLNKLEADTGVPGQYILAISWVETKNGKFTGKYDVIPALITMASVARTEKRKEMFRREAVIGLQVANAGYSEILNKPGSHMGAFGYTQFLPSSFQRLAVDGDGDGRKDVWSSFPDAFASTANYLKHVNFRGRYNWKPGQRWGHEVSVPPDFNKALYTDILDQQHIKTPAEWARLGVTLPDGSPLPDSDPANARIIEPGGPLGPKYMVFDNFIVFMGYNSSYKYALSLAQLGDRIAASPSSDYAPGVPASPLSSDYNP